MLCTQCVCLEETSELRCFVACPFHHNFWIVVGIEVNQMLAREMYLQPNDIRGFAMHAEMEDSPDPFGSSYETAVDVFADLIVTLHLK